MRFVLVLLCLITATPVSSQVQMDRVVIGSVGGVMSNGNLRLDVTIGQPAIGASTRGSTIAQVGYWWQVSTTTVDVGPINGPTTFTLGPIAPNPFVTQTTIRYAIPSEHSGSVYLGVYDVRGRRVKILKNQYHEPGQYTVTWNGEGESGGRVPAGIYFITIHAGSFHETRKTLILK